MMTRTKEILADLQADGVKLSVVDGGLELKAAKGKIKPEVLDRLRQHKGEIIDLLTMKANEPRKRGKHQVSCRAFEINGILMATRPEDCLDRQGKYCENCELRVTP